MKTALKGSVVLGCILTGNAVAERSPVITILVFNQAEVDRLTLMQAEKTAAGIYQKTGVETQWIEPTGGGSFPLPPIQLKILPSLQSLRSDLPDKFPVNAMGLAPGNGPDRHTVSDVCTLRKDAVSWDEKSNSWRIFVRTQKTGDPVFLPIPETLKVVLDALPLPRNAAQNCPYYFWNGVTSRRAVVGIAERTLAAVFKKSCVKDAHAHRYRHTLATRLLEQGATF